MTTQIITTQIITTSVATDMASREYNIVSQEIITQVNKINYLKHILKKEKDNHNYSIFDPDNSRFDTYYEKKIRPEELILKQLYHKQQNISNYLEYQDN